MNSIFDRVLQAARQLGASDVHLKAGLPPVFRIKGDLRTVRDVPPLTREVVQTFALGIMNDRQRDLFERTWDVDLAYATSDGVRYRVNVFQQRGAVGMVMRLIPPDVPPFEKLNLPAAVLALADSERGMVLVTGVTGSGKSTTLAAMVDYINSRRACHILTVEDPVEYAFKDRRSVINQREIGFDTTSFSKALRAALRQDPDVILVGEMRDLETIEIAMLAAETGHLVLSTLHTLDAVETVNRIVSVFPPHQQAQARLQLAGIIKGVISQRLVPRADGKGMVPAVEILVGTARVRELIADPKRTREINEAIATGKHPYGMVSFDQSLTDLVRSKTITYEEALSHATNPDDFALFFRGVSKGGSTVDEPGPHNNPADAELEVDDGSIVDPAAPGGFQIDRFKR
ncbi:MAG TPA: type IV pilus twitching motility protein PilT [Polyangia bacterium]|jgi:twitching motility protein PilT|nr:type IV pilus twitching motility protein PilT [Polyangia bacterium]